MPFGTREIKYRNVAFELELPRASARTVYVRLQSATSLNIKLNLTDNRVFAGDVIDSQLFFGLYFGAVLIMSLYNFALYLAIRDKSYIYFVTFAMMSGLAFMYSYGLGFQYLWGGFPQLNGYIGAAVTLIAIGFSTLFTMAYLKLATTAPRINKIFKFSLILCFLTLAALPVLGVGRAFIAAGLLVLWFVPLNVAAGVQAIRKGFGPAKIYLASWIALLLGVLPNFLKNFGIIPANTVTI